jgi:predicted nucleic-acid-binding protein
VIGLDANVLVRAIMRDDPSEAQAADAVLATLNARESGYVPLVVAVELWWVLTRSYKRSEAQVLGLFRDLLDSDDLVFEAAERVERALGLVAQGAGFADALITITAKDAGCGQVVTFDKNAAARAAMTRLNGPGSALPTKP